MSATVISISRKLLAAALVAVTGLPGAGPTPAGAQTVVTGVEKVTGARSAEDSQSPKHSVAVCPPGKQILGGGGWAFETGVTTRRLTLTRLEPSNRIVVGDQIRHGYRVSAAETTPGVSGNWWVQAYALCANPVPGHDIVPNATAFSSASPMQATAAVCPSGKSVVGSGARINSPSPGQVVLQMARSSGPGDIARAQAHEDADGYAGLWSLVAFAVCANTPQGYEVVMEPSLQRVSEADKLAVATCPNDPIEQINKQLLGAGGAIGSTAPGHVSLQVVYPFNDLRPGTVQALAVENTPTSLNWDFIVAAAICAD